MRDTVETSGIGLVIERAGDFLAVISEHVVQEADGYVAGVICDGCGTMASVRAQTKDALFEALPLALEGWRVTQTPEDDDFCPACVEQAAI